MLFGSVFQISRAAHNSQSLIILSFRVREPGHRGLLLNLNLRGPVIANFCPAERLLKRSKLLDLLTGDSSVTYSRGANRAGEMNIGLSKRKARPGKSSWMQSERSSFIPAMSFQRIAGRNRRPGKSRLENLLVNLAERVHLIENGFGLLILRALQVRIDQVVQRMKLILRGPSGITLCHLFPGNGSR